MNLPKICQKAKKIGSKSNTPRNQKKSANPPWRAPSRSGSINNHYAIKGLNPTKARNQYD